MNLVRSGNVRHNIYIQETYCLKQSSSSESHGFEFIQEAAFCLNVLSSLKLDISQLQARRWFWWWECYGCQCPDPRKRGLRESSRVQFWVLSQELRLKFGSSGNEGQQYGQQRLERKLHVTACLEDSLSMTARPNPRGSLLVGLKLFGPSLVLGQLGDGSPPQIFFNTVFSRRTLTYALQRGLMSSEDNCPDTCGFHTHTPQLLGIYIKIMLGHRSHMSDVRCSHRTHSVSQFRHVTQGLNNYQVLS